MDFKNSKMSWSWLFLIISLVFVQSIAANYCEPFETDKTKNSPECMKCGAYNQESYDLFCNYGEDTCGISYSPPNIITMDCNNSMICLDMKLQIPNLIHNPIFEYVQCPVLRYKPLVAIPKRLGLKNPKRVTITSPTMDVRSSLRNSNQAIFSGIEELNFEKFDKMFVLNEQLLESAKNLRKLSISDSVVKISENFFNNMENLEELHIVKNDVRELNLEALRKVAKLETLVLHSLDKMWLGNIPTNIFENYTSIRRLLLQNFRLVKIPDGLFKNLETLVKLELPGNDIRFLPITPCLNSSGHLTEIDLRFNRLSSIPRNFLKNLFGLKTLLLAYQKNSMVEIPGEVFEDLRNLQTLDLSYVGLQKLSYGMFKYVLQLRSLTMPGNNLDYIPKYIFRGLYKLKKLDLRNQDNNNIMFIEEEAFGDLKDLESLDLSRNRITFVHERTFSNLTELKKLDLSYNGITKLSENLLSNLTKLETLNFYNQQNITEISKDAFKSLKMLKELDLSYNGLKFIPEGIFDNNVNLKLLNLENNRLTKITGTIFSGLRNLNQLFMNFNFLKEIDIGAFKSMQNLKFAALCGNHLNFDSSSGISPFYSNDKIEELDLCHNNISYIADDWRNAPSLKMLNLQGNNLKTLEANDFAFESEDVVVNLEENKISRVNLNSQLMLTLNERATKRTEIKMKDNKIMCDCDLVPFIRLAKHELMLATENRVLIQFKNLTCHGPDEMAGKNVLNFNYDSCFNEFVAMEIIQPAEEENLQNAPETDENYVVITVLSVDYPKNSTYYFIVWLILFGAIIYWVCKYAKSQKKNQFSYAQLDKGHYLENISTQGQVFVKAKTTTQ